MLQSTLEKTILKIISGSFFQLQPTIQIETKFLRQMNTFCTLLKIYIVTGNSTYPQKKIIGVRYQKKAYNFIATLKEHNGIRIETELALKCRNTANDSLRKHLFLLMLLQVYRQNNPGQVSFVFGVMKICV